MLDAKSMQDEDEGVVAGASSGADPAGDGAGANGGRPHMSVRPKLEHGDPLCPDSGLLMETAQPLRAASSWTRLGRGLSRYRMFCSRNCCAC